MTDSRGGGAATVPFPRHIRSNERMNRLEQQQFDQVVLKIYGDRADMGRAAAADAACRINERLQDKAEVNCIFAAAPSQDEFLKELCNADIPWRRVNAFHMDEYVGLSPDHPAAFGNYLNRTIFGRVPFGHVHLIDGQRPCQEECRRYSELLDRYPPDITFMGIGENGHIAFNEPKAADFADAERVKPVRLDLKSRRQQVHDGCFARLEEVPVEAITLTIPVLISAVYVFCMVPGPSKASALRRALKGPVSAECPASILRTQQGACIYADRKSASLLIRP